MKRGSACHFFRSAADVLFVDTDNAGADGSGDELSVTEAFLNHGEHLKEGQVHQRGPDNRAIALLQAEGKEAGAFRFPLGPLSRRPPSRRPRPGG